MTPTERLAAAVGLAICAYVVISTMVARGRASGVHINEPVHVPACEAPEPGGLPAPATKVEPRVGLDVCSHRVGPTTMCQRPAATTVVASMGQYELHAGLCEYHARMLLPPLGPVSMGGT